MVDSADSVATGDTPGPDKPIYTISVASEILETHPRTLMLYEQVGLVRPARTPTNRRRYSQRDVNRLRVIQTLTRRHGLNLAAVRYVLELLRRLREQNVELPRTLGDLDLSGVA